MQQQLIKTIYICNTEIVLNSDLKTDENYMLIENAAKLLNRGTRTIVKVCHNLGIPIIKIEGSLTNNDKKPEKLKFIPMNSFYLKFQESSVIKREIKPEIKRIVKPYTSGFHHRLTAQRFIISPDKILFLKANIGNMPLKGAYFGLFFNLLLYAKANQMNSMNFKVSYQLIKEYNWSQFKKKEKLISNFSESFERISLLYYEEMKVYIQTKEVEIEKGTFDNKSFLELIMYCLPVSEPYFEFNYLMDPSLTELVDELRLRAQTPTKGV